MSDRDDHNVIHVNFGRPAEAEPETSDAADASTAPTEDGGAEAAETSDVDQAGVEKLRIFTELLANGTVMVTVDARRPGVGVPSQFHDDFRLNLNFCHLFGIPDFEYDAHGVRASLSFNRKDFFCDIPWSAVYMLRSQHDNDVVLFPTELPPEMGMLIPEIERAIAEHTAKQEDDAPSSPGLTVIEVGEDED